jgi:hypothetical protein
MDLGLLAGYWREAAQSRALLGSAAARRAARRL